MVESIPPDLKSDCWVKVYSKLLPEGFAAKLDEEKQFGGGGKDVIEKTWKLNRKSKTRADLMTSSDTGSTHSVP